MARREGWRSTIARSFDPMQKEAGRLGSVPCMPTRGCKCIVQGSNSVLHSLEEQYYFQESTNLLSVISCTYIKHSINGLPSRVSLLGYLLLFVASHTFSLSLSLLSQSKLGRYLGRSDPRYQFVQYLVLSKLHVSRQPRQHWRSDGSHLQLSTNVRVHLIDRNCVVVVDVAVRNDADAEIRCETDWNTAPSTTTPP